MTFLIGKNVLNSKQSSYSCDFREWKKSGERWGESKVENSVSAAQELLIQSVFSSFLISSLPRSSVHVSGFLCLYLRDLCRRTDLESFYSHLADSRGCGGGSTRPALKCQVSSSQSNWKFQNHFLVYIKIKVINDRLFLPLEHFCKLNKLVCLSLKS